MPFYSVSDAREQLSALVERALRGERVIITRYGQPVVELKVIGQSGFSSPVTVSKDEPPSQP